MSKRCPDCGFVNEDSRIYCGSCGEPLDAELRLIKNLESQKNAAPAKETSRADDSQPASRRRTGDDEEYVHHKMAREKKSSAAPWIILALVAVVVVVLVLSYAV